jgi:predicted transcriptional regulator
MDIIYRLGAASVSDVRSSMSSPPSYSTIRTLMGTLLKKGHLQHVRDGNRYIYRPVVSRSVAQRSALSRIVHSFFGGSAERAAVTLLEMADLPEGKLTELRSLVLSAEE